MSEGRSRYYIDDDIEVVLERAEGNVYAHIGINRINKTIVTKIRGIWAQIVFELYEAGYPALYTYTKDKRVVRLIGDAEYLGDAEGHGVYKWDLT